MPWPGLKPGPPDLESSALTIRPPRLPQQANWELVIKLVHPQFKYMISYIHYFIFIFPGCITNQFNDQLPVGLLAQFVRVLHRYGRGQGSSPSKPDFFNCEDLIYSSLHLFFIHSSNILFHIFIISFYT